MVAILAGFAAGLTTACSGSDATVEPPGDGGPGDPDAGSGSDAGTHGDGATIDDAGSEGGIDAGDDSGGGCVGAPVITFVAPSSGESITVKTNDPSTFHYDFKVKVAFCNPMKSVVLDYEGPMGAVLEQHKEITTFADPFVQTVEVGGSTGSLATHNGGTATSSWNVVVNATDNTDQSTLQKLPFTLVVEKK